MKKFCTFLDFFVKFLFLVFCGVETPRYSQVALRARCCFFIRANAISFAQKGRPYVFHQGECH